MSDRDPTPGAILASIEALRADLKDEITSLRVTLMERLDSLQSDVTALRNEGPVNSGKEERVNRWEHSESYYREQFGVVFRQLHTLAERVSEMDRRIEELRQRPSGGPS